MAATVASRLLADITQDVTRHKLPAGQAIPLRSTDFECLDLPRFGFKLHFAGLESRGRNLLSLEIGFVRACCGDFDFDGSGPLLAFDLHGANFKSRSQIGRASCRERV